MNKVEYEILSLYKKSPNRVFSTTEIVISAEPDEYNQIERALNDPLSAKDQLKQAKRAKAQLHRKILYHLNKLVENNVLKVERSGEKGEKYFSMELEEGEEISVTKYKKTTITVSKPQTPAMPIEGYESEGIVKKFEQATWIDRLNCLLFEAEAIKNIEMMTDIIKQSFSAVNDSITINNFENIAQNNETVQVITQLDHLENECKDFAKKTSLIIDVSRIGRPELMQRFLKEFSEKKYENISIILNIESKDLAKHSNQLLNIINDFSKNGVKLQIKNSTITKSPHTTGKEGIYRFNEDEWEFYQAKIKGKISTVSVAQTTITVDLKKFYEKFGLTADIFDSFMIKCAESLLSANSIQRKKAVEYFTYLIDLNSPHMREVFMFSRNYIRFKNYSHIREKFGEEFCIDLFERIKNMITEFCHSEETIYKSCGMPTRFSICLSVDPEEPIETKNIEEMYTKEFKEKIKSVEQLSNIMDGGIIKEFVKQRNIKAEDILQEITILLNTYKLPFITYTFKKTKDAETKLSEFI